MTGELAVRKRGEVKAREDFESLGESFLASQDVRENSKRTYWKGLRRFFEWMEAERVTSPRREDILSYKNFLEKEELSSFTVSSYLVAVRKFFEWMEAEKRYLNIARGVKTKTRAGFSRDALTVSQVKKLFSGLPRLSLQEKRDFALLNLLTRTGLRTIEAVRANIEDIRQEGGEATLKIQGKGRDAKDEIVLLTEETLSPIRDYLGGRGKVKDGSPLFHSLSDRNRGGRLTTQSISRIVKTHFRAMGLNSRTLTAHSLRHTAITFSLLGGATIQEAQAFGRHKDINTTLVYAHNVNRIANAPERKIDALLALAS